ncbi:MAG TPA: methyltransferase domain-containing protein [Rhizobacter sp.]
MTHAYVHGYRDREQQRLHDQARTLADLLHHDTRFPAGSHVLEAGCGTGAQTLTLAAQSPGARFTCVDISPASLALARERCAGLGNTGFLQADLRRLPFEPASFDHVFVCFVLEHLPDPAGTLRALLRLLRPGGTLVAIEGDHGSTLFHPEDAAARHAIDCQVELQARAGGDACIGRRLHPLLQAAGAAQVEVSPRFVYADASRPEWVEGFTRRTFTAMVEGVRDDAIAAGLTTAAAFDAGVQALHRTAEADGVFCYTFFKAVARVA